MGGLLNLRIAPTLGGRCACCNKTIPDTKHLFYHHWYDYKTSECHARLVCQSCNEYLKLRHFPVRKYCPYYYPPTYFSKFSWESGLEVITHIMPNWDFQLEYVSLATVRDSKGRVVVFMPSGFKALLKRHGSGDYLRFLASLQSDADLRAFYDRALPSQAALVESLNLA